MLTFIYLVIIEDYDATKDIKTTLKQILECQQSLMKLIETVENAIKDLYDIYMLLFSFYHIYSLKVASTPFAQQHISTNVNSECSTPPIQQHTTNVSSDYGMNNAYSEALI